MTPRSLPRHALLPLLTPFVTGVAFANPIAVRGLPISQFPLVTWAWIVSIALLAEFLVVLDGVRKVKPLTTRRFAIAFLFTHCLTFPVTLLLSHSMGVAAEAFPLIFEPWLLSRFAGLPLRRIWLLVVFANLMSFVLGLALTYPISRLP